MKAAKWILLTLVGLVVVLVIGIAFVALAVDPNRFKPQIEQLAEREGIDLAISGDLEWRFFPSVAISVGTTRASGPDMPEIAFDQAYLQVAWGPLLRRNIAVKGIAVDGLSLDLGDAATGEDAVTASGGVPLALGGEQDLGDGTRLAIESISLTNSQIIYRDAAGAQAYIRDIQFSAERFNTDGTPFPVQLSMVLPEDIAGTPLKVELDTRLRSSSDFMQLGLENARVTASSLDDSEALLRDLSASFSADVDRLADRAVISDLQITLQDLRANGHLEAEQFSTDPRATGNFSIAEFNPRGLLAALEVDLTDVPDTALRTVALATDFSASGERVSLRDLSLRLDDIRVAGGLDAGLQPRSLDLTLNGSRVDLRQYTTPAADDSGKAEQALLAPVAGALLWLENGRGNISVDFEEVVTEEITLDQPRLRLGANNNVLAINQIAAGAWGGQLNLGGNIDFNHPEPAVQLQLEITDVDLHQALTQLAEFEDITGRGNLQFRGKTSGEATETLQRNLIGEGRLQLTQPYFASFNVERAYCEMAALVEQRSMTGRTWDEGTQFVDFEGDFHIAGNRIVLNQYQSGIGNLGVRGNGRVDLEEQAYEVLINANLQAETTSEQGCEVRSSRIRNRDIPIQCRGDFDGSASCRPDPQFVQQLVRGQLEGLLRDRLNGRGEDGEGNGEESEQPRDEDPVRSLLRGVLGR